MLRLVKTLASSVVLAGCSVVGVRAGYDQPDYRVLATLDGGIDVRRYQPRTAAETVVTATSRRNNEGRAFALLADYIFGHNRVGDRIAMTSPVETASRSAQIAMTSPVETASATGTYRMRFFLPAGYTAATAPQPMDSRVRLVDLPAQTMAVLRFSGTRDDDAVDGFTARLLAALERSAWRPVGEPVAFFYDPPWTLPPLRRNEVAVAVAPR